MYCKCNMSDFQCSNITCLLGLKDALFDELLFHDTWLIGMGALFVLCCMWIYTGSLFITLMTIIAIGFSLGIAYFIYTLVFEMHFFPFMNLLASIVAVGKYTFHSRTKLKYQQCNCWKSTFLLLFEIVFTSILIIVLKS